VPRSAAERAAARVRHFNRFYTRRLGLLDEGHLRSPFSLAEVRVLYEVAHGERPTAGAVASALALDPGYLSRMLRGLRQRGLIRARRTPADKRQRELALTARGHKVFAALDARATDDVAAMLAGLSSGDRERLVAALETIEALLAGPSERRPGGPPAIALRPPRPGDLGWVVERHGELYAEEYGWNEEFERLVARIVGEFAAGEPDPRRRCWIATLDGRRAGSVFLMPGDPGAGRLRLLLVEPWARGFGMGARLVSACIDAAREAGCHTLTLWTNDVLTAARRLYERAGFRLIGSERFRGFGKMLTSQTWSLALSPEEPPATRTGSAPGGRRGSSTRA
jgi:DNA-binding MarR family transcriptional regulator/GNAT superfamily N-acetyltransferase